MESTIRFPEEIKTVVIPAKEYIVVSRIFHDTEKRAEIFLKEVGTDIVISKPLDYDSGGIIEDVKTVFAEANSAEIVEKVEPIEPPIEVELPPEEIITIIK